MARPGAPRSDIQKLLEDLTAQAEARNGELKRQLDDLSTKPVVHKPLAAKVVLRDNVTLRVGTSKFDRIVRSTATYQDLLSTIKAATGQEGKYVAYRDAQGRLVWIRTNQDVRFMIASYFAEGIPFRQITILQEEELGPLVRFDLRKEHAHKDGMPVFRVECAGEEAPLIYLSIPANSTREETLEHFESLFGQVVSLNFDDPDDDRIAINGQEAWEYCIETAVAMSEAGKYLLLRIEGMSAD
jgi:hypothetical protein